MTIIRKLLGVKRYWGEKEPICMGLTLFNHESCYPPFLPVICKKSNFPRARVGGSHECINLFPTTKNNNPRNRQSLSGQNVIEAEDLRLLDDREIITTDKINFNKMPSLAEYVKKHGAVTFEIENARYAADFIRNVEKLKQGYRHSALLLKNTGSSSPPNSHDEKLITYLSVYDLLRAIPIYSPRKAEGLAFHLIMLWDKSTEKSDRPQFAGEFYFAVNQYRENLLVVDGQKTFSEGFIGSDYIGHFNALLINEAKRQAEVSKLSKKSKKDEPSKGKEKKSAGVLGSEKISFYDAGSTANYYYTANTSTWTSTS